MSHAYYVLYKLLSRITYHVKIIDTFYLLVRYFQNEPALLVYNLCLQNIFVQGLLVSAFALIGFGMFKAYRWAYFEFNKPCRY